MSEHKLNLLHLAAQAAPKHVRGLTTPQDSQLNLRAQTKLSESRIRCGTPAGRADRGALAANQTSALTKALTKPRALTKPQAQKKPAELNLIPKLKLLN